MTPATPVLAASVIILAIAGCGAGDGATDAAAQRDVATVDTAVDASTSVTFPPFTAIRSDFLDVTEGLAANPLDIATPPCPYTPHVDWQAWLCANGVSVPTTYATTNGFTSGGNPYESWIISSNNEFVQTAGCNSGPPNQSLGPNDYPFSLVASPTSLWLQVTHDTRPFCDKIPYMSATYIRGAQAGDPNTRMLSWAELAEKKLTLEVELSRTTDELAWFRVLTHFRDPNTTQRYFVNKDYVAPDTLADYWMNWNWPYKASFYHPGARIAIPARVPSQSLARGAHTITIDVAAQAVQYFPEFATSHPDFLGVEIAIELGPVVNATAVSIRRVELR